MLRIPKSRIEIHQQIDELLAKERGESLNASRKMRNLGLGILAAAGFALLVEESICGLIINSHYGRKYSQEIEQAERVYEASKTNLPAREKNAKVLEAQTLAKSVEKRAERNFRRYSAYFISPKAEKAYYNAKALLKKIHEEHPYELTLPEIKSVEKTGPDYGRLAPRL